MTDSEKAFNINNFKDSAEKVGNKQIVLRIANKIHNQLYTLSDFTLGLNNRFQYFA